MKISRSKSTSNFSTPDKKKFPARNRTSNTRGKYKPMKTTNSHHDKSKPRRRRGLLADELAKGAKVSRYVAKQALAVNKHAPELLDFVTNGEMKLGQATYIMRNVPELIPYLLDGRLPCAECDRVIRELRQLGEQELSFEEGVERSYKHWLSKWPKEDRKEVHEIVEFMPSAKLADLIPSQKADNLAVEIDLENENDKPTG